MRVIGTPIAPAHPRAPACQLHPMGASVHPSCTDPPFAIRNHKSPRQWAHACKPHEHRLGEYLHSAADLILMFHLTQLFKRMLDQFDRLRKRNAFLEQYKKERMFENGLEEFDDARYAYDRFAGSGLIDHMVIQSDGRRTIKGVQGLRESRLHLIRTCLVCQVSRCIYDGLRVPTMVNKPTDTLKTSTR